MKVITYLKKIITALISFPSKLLPSRWLRKMNSDQRRFFNLIVTGIVLVVGTWTITSLLSPDKSDAAWWNDSWQYRQVINATITSPSSNLSKVETLITIDTQSLISNGKLQSSCQDLRFTTNNGTILPYYIDSGCNTTTTKIWIMVDQIQVNTTQYSLLMYYGNNSATAVSDQNTFKLLRGVVGYWTSNDTSGATLSDSSPQANNGTLDIGATGTQTTTTQAWTNGASGKYASSINLDGTDDKVTISTSAAQLTTGMTISTWIKPTAGGSTQNIVDNSNAWSYRFYRNGTTLGLQLSTNGANNGYHTASNALTAGVWQHIVAVFNGSNVILYVNGIQVLSEAAGTATIQSPSAGWILGSYGTGEYYNGSLDDTRIYNRALTTSEITDLYQNPGTIASIDPGTSRPTVTFGSEEKSEGPVLHLSFNEGTGTTANDSTSSKKNGTISGATWKSEEDCVDAKCLYFDGSADNVALSGSLKLPNQFTISHWVRTSASTGQMYTVGNAGSGNGYRFGLSGGKVQFLLGNGTTHKESACGTRTVNDNQWHLITGVFDATGTFDCYIDGQHEAQVTFTNVTGFQTTAPGIGAPVCCQDYLGFIDEVKIYPYARTVDQIKTDFNSGSAVVLGAKDSSSLSNGLVGYWNMDNNVSGNSQTLIDTSGNNNSATTNNGTNTTGMDCTVTGKYGAGCNLDGIDDRMTVPYSSSLNLSNDFTFSTWLYNREPIGSTYQKSILYHETYLTNGFRIWIETNNKVSLFTTSSGGTLAVTTATALAQNQWYHLTFSYNSNNSTGTIYINGQQAATGTGTYIPNTSSNFEFGSAAGDSRYYLDGTFDDTRIYNRTLSPSEVSQLYNYAPPPVAYYDFEEGSGTNVYDRSGNGNTGTWSSELNNYGSGKYGKAGNFNGTSSYVDTGSNIQLANKSFTVSFWAKRGTNNANHWIVTQGIQSANNGIHIGFRSTNTFTCAFYGNDLNTNTTYTDSDWHYWSCTYDAETNRRILYRDGVQVAINTASSDFLGTGNLNIGRLAVNNSGHVNGLLDDVRIYYYSRTPSQIIEDMNAGHPIGGSPVGSQVGYWKLDEGTGTTANNSGNAGSAINGTLLNSPTWSLGKSGKALTFDGTDDYVNMGNPTSLQITGDLSISAWVKTTETGQGGIVSKFYNTDGNRGYRFLTSNGSLSLNISSDGTANASCSIAAGINNGTWHHVIAVFDALNGTAKIYKNGTLIQTCTSFPNAIYNPSQNFNIGTSDAGTTGTNTYTGQIDEVKIYNTALTDEEIKTDYNSGQSLQFGVLGTEADGTPSNSSDRAYCPPGDTTASCGPVGEWKFDDRYGTTPKDTSGSGYNGTFVGTPTWTQGKIGSALSFNGTNQYVTMGDNLDLIGSPLTISVWVKPRNHVAYGGIVSKLASAGNYRLVMNDTTGKVSFGIRASDNTFQAMASTSTLPLNEWSHIVVTYDNATTAKMYINGKLDVQSSAFTVSRGDATTSFAVGYNSNNAAYFDGAIDHVQLYNYVRSDAQVAWDYSRGAPIAHYKLNECQGAIVHSSILPYSSLLNGTINVGTSGTQTSVGTCQTAGTAWGNGASGKFDSSLNFDGSNDYIDFGDPASGILDITGDMTVSAWVKPSNLTGIHFILSKYYLGEFELGTNENGLIWRHGNGSTYSGPQWNSFFSEGTDTWYHVVIVRKASNTTLSAYKNGKSFGSPQSYSVSPAASTNSFYIGSRSGGGYYFNGQIDEVQIYNYALTSQQIKDIMNQGAIRFGP